MLNMDHPPFADDVPTASLVTIDFGALADHDHATSQALFEAATTSGMFLLKNHGVDYQFMFDLAHEVFGLGRDELMKFTMGTKGGYFGYKAAGGQIVDDQGTKDFSQFYNISKDDMLSVGDYPPFDHPEAVHARRSQLTNFIRSCHAVATVIARSLSSSLGLPTEALSDLHRLDRTGGDNARVTHAPPLQSTAISLGEHTDFGSISILWNQLGGLQVLERETGRWTYVKPQPPAAVVNLGDCIAKLTGGRLHSTVHRVVGAPGDQARLVRHSVGYFVRPNGDVKLRSLFVQDPAEEDDDLTADAWIARRARRLASANYKGQGQLGSARGTEFHASQSQSQSQSPLPPPPTTVQNTSLRTEKVI